MEALVVDLDPPLPPSTSLPSDPPSSIFPYSTSRPPEPLSSVPASPISPPLPNSFARRHRFPTLLLPGEAYAIYASRDVTGQMPREIEVLMERAAEVVGVGKEEVVREVYLLEKRLQRVMKRQNKDDWLWDEEEGRAGDEYEGQGEESDG